LSGGLVLFQVVGNEDRTLDKPATAVSAPEPEVALEEDGLTKPAAVQALDAQLSGAAARTAVEAESVRQEVDPCAGIRAEYEAALAECRAFEAECLELRSGQHWLEDRIRTLELELVLAKKDESTPLGAFFLSDEAKAMSPKMRKMFAECMQTIFPVFLQPGEATWIVERIQNDDSHLFGRTFNEAVIRFLGPQRVLAGATPTWLEYQKQFVDDQEWLALFGTPKPD